MPKERILLISLFESTSSIGVKYIHSSLIHKGYDSSILFCTSNDLHYVDKIAQFVQREKFTIVGLSVYSPFFTKAVNIITAIRQKLGNDIVIVMGGVHPTIAPDDCFPYCDYVCAGEAELAFPKFLEGFRSGVEVDGFIKSTSKVITYCAAPTNLDELPFPEHYPDGCHITDNGAVVRLDDSLFRKHSRYSGGYAPIVTSRGCPYRCSYCCNHLIAKAVGHKIRRRSPANVMGEVNAIRKKFPNLHYIELADECFMTHSIDWIREFSAAYKPTEIPFIFRSIPSYITDEKIGLLEKCGLSLICLGLQSGSERTNKKYYNRHFSIDEFIKAAKIIDIHGVPALYDVIVDNPFEDTSDILSTMDVVSRLPSSCDVLFYSLTFYQNTELYNIAKEHGLDLSSSKEKSQHCYEFWGREVKLVRVAQFMPFWLCRLAIDNPRLLNLLYVISAFLLWPLRSLKMAILFNKGNPLKLARFIRHVSLPYIKRIVYPKFSF